MKLALLRYFFLLVAVFSIGFNLGRHSGDRQFSDLVKASNQLLGADERLKQADADLKRSAEELRQALSECRAVKGPTT